MSSLSKPLNVAASNIDDAAGNLEGYTAIVYEGLAEEQKNDTQTLPNHESSTSLNQRSQAVDSGSSDELTASEALPDQNENEEEKEVVTVRSVKKSYVEKGASVFEINVADPSEYDTRSVVRAGKYTFGILSVDNQTAASASELEAYIQKRVKEYEAIKIDFVILVVSDLDLLMTEDTMTSSAEKTSKENSEGIAEEKQKASSSVDLENANASDASASDGEKKKETKETAKTKKQIALKGVDIVISTQDEGLNSGGVLVDGIFYDDVPLKKEVGTILVSPSKVISAKDVK